VLRAELANDRRLADARLAADEHEPSGTGPRRGERVFEDLERFAAFEQLERCAGWDGRRDR
jgi:hypothetical protein